MRSVIATVFLFAVTAVIAIDVPHGNVIIKNPKSGLVVTDGTDKVTVETLESGNDNQLWTFEITRTGSYFIFNKGTQKALEETEDGYAATGEPHGCMNQQWLVNEDNTIENAKDGLVLDIQDEKLESGTRVIVYRTLGQDNQKFVLESA